jgi:hypothetical protein
MGISSTAWKSIQLQFRMNLYYGTYQFGGSWDLLFRRACHGICRGRARAKLYLQSSSFFIVIDIQPTLAGEWRGEQMKIENWLHFKR